MTALDLFLYLTAAGCQFIRQGETLLVHDPQHVLTDAVRKHHEPSGRRRERLPESTERRRHEEMR
jgi:hypothetical protein